MAILDTSKKQLIQDRDENIFIGIDLPFRKSNGKEGWFASTKTTIEAVKQNLLNLCSTEAGERVMQPNLGVKLKRFLFEPYTQDLVVQLKDVVMESINYWLPFITINNIEVQMSDNQSGEGRNTMEVAIFFSLIQGPNSQDSIQVTIGE